MFRLSKKPQTRRAVRSSRPDSERFFTVMLVFSHRTFRWSLARKSVLWAMAWAVGIWGVAMIGSAYGLWATKKIMSFAHLQGETQSQERQLHQALREATKLQEDVLALTQQFNELKRQMDDKSGGKEILPMPSSQGRSETPPQGTEEQKIGTLRKAIASTSAQARLIRTTMGPIVDQWNHTPSIPPTAGYLSSGYGFRISPFSRRNESGEGIVGYHHGFDICNAEGTPIQTTADGIVTSAGWMDRYGNAVIVQHAPGMETLYAHLAAIKVKEGQNLRRGDLIGTMGRTGNATGVHLHYEVRKDGQPVNPQPYLRLQRKWLASLQQK